VKIAVEGFAVRGRQQPRAYAHGASRRANGEPEVMLDDMIINLVNYLPDR